MAGRGWRGDPPSDDEQARERIIAAAKRCVDLYGPAKTNLSDVAAELGVTRQTVYRLFRSSDELLDAVAMSAADPFVDRLVARARAQAGTDPAEMLVECLAFTLEQIPQERYLSLVLAPRPNAGFTQAITARPATDLTDALLTRLPVDWHAIGIDPPRRAELIEMYLRTLHSLVLDPGPTRTPSQLRSFLRRWIGPAIGTCGHEPKTETPDRP